MELHFEEIDSTSAYLKRKYLEYDNLTFVSASYQSNGKGRNARQWISAKNTNLLFSLLIKDKELNKHYSSISLASAVSILKSLKQIGLNNVSIKWPNDVFVNDKKICGILLEGSLPDYLVIGIGVNVNQIEFPNESFNISPTSIAFELGKKIDLNDIKEIIYSNLLDELNKIKNGDKSYLNIVRENNYLLNKTVYGDIRGSKQLVKIVGINEDDSLKVALNDAFYDITTGEISFHMRRFDYDLYLFDFDGTLFDTFPSLDYVFEKAYKAVGIEFDKSNTVQFSRIPLIEGYKMMHAPEDKFMFFGDKIREYVDSHESVLLTEKYSDTDEFFKKLKEENFLSGIVTSNSSYHVKDVLTYNQIPENIFAVYIGNSECNIYKPKPDPILKALEMIGYKGDLKRVCYVGDGLNDMKSALAAGVTPILIDRQNKFEDSKDYKKISSLLDLFN